MFWWHTAIYRKRKAFVIPRVSDQSRCWKRSLDRKETDAGAPWALDNISFLIEVWNLETTLWVQLLLLDMLVIFLLLLNRIFLNKKKFTWNWCWFNFFLSRMIRMRFHLLASQQKKKSNFIPTDCHCTAWSIELLEKFMTFEAKLLVLIELWFF